jgi:CRISPR/Cas system-associated endonuclease Cas1
MLSIPFMGLMIFNPTSAYKFYWNCFKYFVKAMFKERKKRFNESKDSLNVCLNYGCSILVSQVWHAVELNFNITEKGFLKREYRKKLVAMIF